MSSFYLCDYCAKKMPAPSIGNLFYCKRGEGIYLTELKVMHDHHGVDGKRYDEPKDICEHYEPREDA